jgi:hypothetical protein
MKGCRADDSLRLTPLLRREIHAAQEVLEARVGAEAVAYGASQSRA